MVERLGRTGSIGSGVSLPDDSFSVSDSVSLVNEISAQLCTGCSVLLEQAACCLIQRSCLAACLPALTQPHAAPWVYRYFANEPFADLHRVEGLRGVFITTLINGSLSEDNMRSVITFDKGGTWELLQAPAADSLGGTVDCQVRQTPNHLVVSVQPGSSHLHQHTHTHPVFRTSPIPPNIHVLKAKYRFFQFSNMHYVH